MLERTLGETIERCALYYGPDIAVVHGERRLTYEEFFGGVRRVGRALLALGLRRGDRVGILMSDRPEVLQVYFGITWAGLVAVSLNARMAAEEHEYVLEDSGAKALCHDAGFASRAAAIRGDALEHLLSVDPDGLAAGGGDLLALCAAESGDPGDAPPVAADDLAAIYYTGGTTGRPKGVAHAHRTILAAFLSETLEMGLGEREVFAHVAPLTHAGGAFALPVWLRGGTNLVLGGFDPDQFLAAVEEHGVTSTMMVPTMIYVLLDHPGLAAADTSSIRTIIYGAAPMGRERLVQGLEHFGPVFCQLYGQTEAPNQLTVLTHAEHAEAVERGDLEVLSSCGRPVTIADVRIVDDEGRDVAPGEPGEIVVRGPHVMLEYWGKPEQTAEAIIDGWLHTGDVARADERGFLYIVDRKKDMVITGGFNVYPKEVEQSLFGHPAVRDVCVIGVPDAKWGEAVKAYVVLEGEASEAELIAWVKERKGSVIAPKLVEVVDAIPLTAVGKHDKPALRKAAREATPA
ncbi:MAG: long-chain fatty acid--CoA ligase [Solirubrobacterales bacterium]|jgi:fatty-acyl-CoA synthase|nr:long-chain fatty acid--CoA ligase [Solirubrobacterales bacterium]